MNDEFSILLLENNNGITGNTMLHLRKERAVVSMLALFSTEHQILTSDKFTMVMFIRGTTVILQIKMV